MDIKTAEERLRNMGYEGFYVWYDPPGTFYDWHTHPEDEVRYVLEGEITIGTEEGVYHLKAGDLLEVKAGTRHWAKTERGVRYLCGSRKAQALSSNPPL
ncbi:MAG: cupin domain-containing protein [Aquificaceae bacterium]|jgi:quercetin dioxygenase-like cupin family protein|uniref:cupin domain-containing protein n=1 Tax=Hydrogenobacter sp. Uz 6-8 TaxID=3384828 RepID=UPI000F24D293|nr:MAG: cupin domain-containing protein [Aquificota bacterium]